MSVEQETLALEDKRSSAAVDDKARYVDTALVTGTARPAA
jgi:hypothetical protein